MSDGRRGAAQSRFFAWWLAGLSCLVPGRLRRVLAPALDFIRVERQDRELVLSHVRPSTTMPPAGLRLPLEADIEAQATLRQWLARRPRARRRVLVRLDSDQGLSTSLRLPAAAEPELGRLIPFEIDRRTPFSADRVYHGFSVQERHPGMQQIDVILTVVPREAVDAVLERLQRLGLQPSAVALGPETAESPEIPIEVPALPAGNRPRRGALLLNRALAALALVLLVAAAWSPAISQKRQLAALEREMQAARQASDRTQALREQLDRTAREAGYLAQKKRTLPPVIVMLEEITRLLPDDTWLQRLEYSAGALQIHGESATASALIAIVEGSTLLRQAEFRSPVVRVEASGRERFHIAAKAAPAGLDEP